MPLTKLDATAALIVIDLQKGIVGIPPVQPAGEIIARSAQLARAFRERRLPVVLVHVTGFHPRRTDGGPPKFTPPPDWAEFVPELAQHWDDLVIAKQTWGAFIGTPLHNDLQRRRVTQVFLTGIATSAGVESTARSAFDHDYNVVLVADAITDRDPDAHHHCVERIFPRIGEVTTTNEVLSMLKDSHVS